MPQILKTEKTMEDQGNYFKGIIPPPIIFFALILIGFIAQWLFPFNLMSYKWPTRLIIGIPLFIAAGLIAINALMIMKKNKTAINFNNPTTKFIVEGSFRFTRNPLYLSLLLVMDTIVIIANSAWHLIAFILLFLFFNFGVVAREEQYLENNFGEEYIQYKNRVRRWI
jgi:protein-S-isoprenylcysteine O-methyltransferase Ste14